jgi:hypothetical protein
LFVGQESIGQFSNREFALVYDGNAAGVKGIPFIEVLIQGGLPVIELAKVMLLATGLLAPTSGGVSGQRKIRVRLSPLK